MLPLVVVPMIGVTGIMLPRKSVKLLPLDGYGYNWWSRAEGAADIDCRYIGDDAM